MTTTKDQKLALRNIYNILFYYSEPEEHPSGFIGETGRSIKFLAQRGLLRVWRDRKGNELCQITDEGRAMAEKILAVEFPPRSPTWEDFED